MTLAAPPGPSVPRPSTRVEQHDQLRAIRARLAVSFAIMYLAGTVGTVGFYALWHREGGTVLDAVYMTFITMTTIGFGEVRPLGTAGRLLTMGVAVTGIGSLFYMLSALMEYVVLIRPLARERKMEKRIAQLEGHVIIAGLGRVGRQAAEELADAGTRFVVMDASDQMLEFAREKGYLYVKGDSASDEALERAGIRRASGLIVTTDNDATNMYVVISAKLINPKLRIVCRAVDESSIPKLMRAGADRAISPYAIGGRRLAHLMSSPNAVDFFETALTRGNKSLSIEDIEVPAGAELVGRTVGSLREEANSAAVLAVLRAAVPMVNPESGLTILPGDRLLALGTTEQLQRLQDRVAPSSPARRTGG